MEGNYNFQIAVPNKSWESIKPEIRYCFSKDEAVAYAKKLSNDLQKEIRYTTPESPWQGNYIRYGINSD